MRKSFSLIYLSEVNSYYSVFDFIHLFPLILYIVHHSASCHLGYHVCSFILYLNNIHLEKINY